MDFFEMMGGINKHHNQLDQEYNRLKQDVPRAVKVGDKVLIAAGLIGRGHAWVRVEGEVLEVGQASIKVRGKQSYSDETWEEWIDPALITDIIKSGE